MWEVNQPILCWPCKLNPLGKKSMSRRNIRLKDGELFSAELEDFKFSCARFECRAKLHFSCDCILLLDMASFNQLCAKRRGQSFIA